jgi:hypothetical protein
MKTYKVSDRNLVSSPETVVCLRWSDGKENSVALKDMPAFLRVAGRTGEWPVRTETEEGLKTGVFPVIVARTEKAAAIMTGKLGYCIAVEDGVSLSTQNQARALAESLKGLGLSMDELVMEWRIGKAQPASAPIAASAQRWVAPIANVADEAAELFG